MFQLCPGVFFPAVRQGGRVGREGKGKGKRQGEREGEREEIGREGRG